jgi:diacylglycerol kinase
VEPAVHPQIKIVKDTAAGAVLWVSMFSAVIGGIIFLPEIFRYL